MRDNELTEGVRFIDPEMRSQPEEYRVHKVTQVLDDKFHAVHIASNTARTFARTFEVLEKLQSVPNRPFTSANLDALVGVHCRAKLKDGGKFTGMVTAIRYEANVIDGVTCRYVREVEFDRSGTTAYPLSDFTSLERI